MPGTIVTASLSRKWYIRNQTDQNRPVHNSLLAIGGVQAEILNVPTFDLGFQRVCACAGILQYYSLTRCFRKQELEKTQLVNNWGQ